MTEHIVFRYLKFRSKRGFVRGTAICRHLRIPAPRLIELNGHCGVGSFGPADHNPKARHLWRRYAKRNVYMADFRYFFECDGRYHCVRQRELRNGRLPPRRVKAA